MVSRNGSSSVLRTYLPIFVVSFIVFFYWGSYWTFFPPDLAMSSSDSLASSLEVSVRQTSVSPPKIAIAVTNKDAEQRTMTVLTWDSPLDPISLQLGLLSLTPEGSSSPLEIATIQPRRMMPPKADQFVEIGPGETKEQEVLIRKPAVPVDELAGKKVGIVCRGEWSAVWPLVMAEVPAESLKKASGSPDALKGSFESESTEIQF